MKKAYCSVVAVAALSATISANAETSFDYSYIDLSYVTAASDTTFFATDNTDYVSIDSNYSPEGASIQLSVPFAGRYFYEVYYHSLENHVSRISVLEESFPVDLDLEQSEGRLGLGYIFPMPDGYSASVKAAWVDGEIDVVLDDGLASETLDYDGFVITGALRYMLTEKLEVNADLGLGQLEIDEDGDLLEIQLGVIYSLSENLSAGLSFKHQEIDDVNTNDPDLVLIGVEEQQTFKASLRFDF